MTSYSEVNTRRYSVFIAYSPADTAFANHLEKVLKRYHVPDETGSSQDVLTVFKDEHDLRDTTYYEAVQKRFKSAEKLIVICSPAARADTKINDYILNFANAKGKESVIPILYAGVPNHAVKNEGLENAAFPDALYNLAEMPSFINFSDFDVQQHKFHKGAYESDWYTLLGRICDMDRLDIAQMERNRGFRRRRKKLFTLVSILTVVAAVSGFLGRAYYLELAAKQKQYLTEHAKEKYRRALHANSENRALHVLHYFSEAITAAPEEAQKHDLMTAAYQFEPVLRLSHIFQQTGSINGGIFARDFNEIWGWNNQGHIHRWQTRSGEQIGETLVHKGNIEGLRFNRAETRLLSWGESEQVKVWQIEPTPQVLFELPHGDGVIDAVFNQDETLIISRGKDFATRLWDAKSGQQIGDALQHDGWVNGILLNADESILFTWSDDSTIKRWGVTNGEQIGQSMRHEGAVTGAILMKQDTELLSWGTDGEIRFWHANSGQSLGKNLQHEDAVSGASINKNQTRLLSWGRDNTARLWQIEERLQIGDPLYHEGWVFGACFNNSETRILTWSYDNTARIWDTNTGKQIGAGFKHSSGPKGNDAGIFGAAFGSADSRVITWGDDNTARIWSVRTGQQIGASLQHDNDGLDNREIKGAIFNPDLTRILTWSTDGTARYWESLMQLPDPDSENKNADLDFPATAYQLQTFALTGTRLDSATKIIQCLTPAQWDSVKQLYEPVAKQHAKECQHPKENIWRRFFLVN